MVTHPNDMTAWADITCQRDHDGAHEAIPVHVELGGPTAYADRPSIPDRLARSFELRVWNPGKYPVDRGPYCPAHDAVSATIVSHGVWEPTETALVLSACAAADAGSLFVDFGVQIGWFSVLAATCGLHVLGFDADGDNLELARANLSAVNANAHLDLERITADSPQLHLNERVAVAKIDLEGAEEHAIRMLRPMIDAGLVDHLLVEISPCFAGYYPDLVVDLVDAGYEAWHIDQFNGDIGDAPRSAFRHLRLDQIDRDALRKTVAGWHQHNIWFSRPGAAW